MNEYLEAYLELVNWCLSFNPNFKVLSILERMGEAKQLFKLNTAPIKSARGKAVGILGSLNPCTHKWFVARLVIHVF